LRNAMRALVLQWATAGALLTRFGEGSGKVEGELEAWLDGQKEAFVLFNRGESCAHCGEVEREAAEAGVTLNDVVPVAVVDVDKFPAVATKYQVVTAPVVRRYKDGKQQGVLSTPTASNLYLWRWKFVEAFLKDSTEDSAEVPATRIIQHRTFGQTIANITGAAFALHVPSMDDPAVQVFQTMAEQWRQADKWLPFLICVDHLVPNAAVLAWQSAYGGADEPKYLNGTTIGEASLGDFIKANRMPLVGVLNPLTQDRYNKGGSSKVDVFVLPRAREFNRDVGLLGGTLRIIARQPLWTDRFNFLVVNTAEMQMWVEEELGVPEEDLPKIISIRRDTPKDRYWLRDAPMVRNVKDWLEEIEERKISPESVMFSAEVPENQTSAVKVIVASTFKDDVQSAAVDALVAVMAPWCEHCKAFHAVLEEFTNKLNKSPGASDLRVLQMSVQDNTWCKYERPPPGEDSDANVPNMGKGAASTRLMRKVCFPALQPLREYKQFGIQKVPALFYVKKDAPFKPLRLPAAQSYQGILDAVRSVNPKLQLSPSGDSEL